MILANNNIGTITTLPLTAAVLCKLEDINNDHGNSHYGEEVLGRVVMNWISRRYAVSLTTNTTHNVLSDKDMVSIGGLMVPLLSKGGRDIPISTHSRRIDYRANIMNDTLIIVLRSCTED